MLATNAPTTQRFYISPSALLQDNFRRYRRRARSTRPRQECDYPSQRLLSRPARKPSGADIDLRPPAPPHPDSVPSLSCEPPESADAADPDAATDPSRNRRAQTWDGYDAATRWSRTGRCASENRLHPASRASRVGRRAWCSCPSLQPRSVLYQFQPDRKSPLATSPTG